MQQPDLRKLAARVAGQQPMVLEAERRRAIAKARDASYIHEFPNALKSGALVVCADCRHFTFGADVGGLGHCDRFNVEAGPYTVFPCGGFDRSGRLC